VQHLPEEFVGTEGDILSSRFNLNNGITQPS